MMCFYIAGFLEGFWKIGRLMEMKRVELHRLLCGRASGSDLCFPIARSVSITTSLPLINIYFHFHFHQPVINITDSHFPR